MLFLTDPAESFELVTTAALSCDWACGFVDMDTATGATAGSAQGNVTTATTTEVVAAPGAGVQRQLKSFTVVNKDAASTQIVTLSKVTGAGTFALAREIPLGPNEVLVYLDTVGFRAVDAIGRVKTETGTSAVLSFNTRTGAITLLSADVAAALGATLPAGVTASSLTSVGTLGSLGVTGTVTAGGFAGPLTGNVTGNVSGSAGSAGTATLALAATVLATPRAINGVDFDGSAAITVPAAAGTLTGATLAAGVTASSLTSVGTLTSLTMAGAIGGVTDLTTTGNTILGNASTDTLNVGNGDLVKDASGNVGIGGTPSVRLDVQGGSLRVNEDGAGTQVIALRSNFAGVGPAVNVTTAHPLLLMTNNTERMRIDTSGNVGIGGAPTANLELARSGTAEFVLRGNGAAYGAGFTIQMNADTNAYLFHRANAALGFGTNNTERMRIDASGNLISSVPASPPSLGTNLQMVVNATTNTNLQFSVRGTDGVTRTANLLLV